MSKIIDKGKGWKQTETALKPRKGYKRYRFDYYSGGKKLRSDYMATSRNGGSPNFKTLTALNEWIDKHSK